MLVIKFKTDQDVIRMANGTDYALGCRYSKFTLTCFLSASNLNISASSQPITRGQRQSPRTSCRACAPSMTCKSLLFSLYLPPPPHTLSNSPFTQRYLLSHSSFGTFSSLCSIELCCAVVLWCLQY